MDEEPVYSDVESDSGNDSPRKIPGEVGDNPELHLKIEEEIGSA